MRLGSSMSILGIAPYLLLVLFVLRAAATTQCQATTYCGTDTAGCTSTLESVLSHTAYKSFDSAVIVASVTTDSTEQMAQFFPKVDEYTVLEIPNTADLLKNDQPTVSFSVIGSGGYIPLPPKRWSTGSYYVGSRSAVINLNAGVISNITWDGNGCEGICDDTACVDGWCGIPFPTNMTSCGDSCNIKIYLVWSGTDRENRKLTSGDFAFSKMQSWWIFNPWKFLVIAADIFSSFGNPGFTDLTDISIPFF